MAVKTVTPQKSELAQTQNANTVKTAEQDEDMWSKVA